MRPIDIKLSLHNVLVKILNTKEITIHHFNYMHCMEFYFVIATIQKEEVMLQLNLEYKFITTTTLSSKQLKERSIEVTK